MYVYGEKGKKKRQKICTFTLTAVVVVLFQSVEITSSPTHAHITTHHEKNHSEEITTRK